MATVADAIRALELGSFEGYGTRLKTVPRVRLELTTSAWLIASKY